MSDVLDADLVSLRYEDRFPTLPQHRVGLWEVVAEARRDGSLDSSNRDQQGYELIGMIATLPKLKAIAFIGGTATKIGERALGEHGDQHAIQKLRSSFSVYTLASAEKLIAWQALREWLD